MITIWKVAATLKSTSDYVDFPHHTREITWTRQGAKQPARWARCCSLNGNPTGTSRCFWYWGSGQEPRATFFLAGEGHKKNVKMPWRSNKLIVSVQELVDNWTSKCTWYQQFGSTRSDLNWTTHGASYLHYRQRVLYVPEESYDESCTMVQLPVGRLRLLIMWRRRVLSRFEVEEILPSVVCKWKCRRQTGAGAYHSCIRAKAGYFPPTPPPLNESPNGPKHIFFST